MILKELLSLLEADHPLVRYAQTMVQRMQETEQKIASELGGGKLDAGRNHPNYEKKMQQAFDSLALSTQRWVDGVKKDPKTAEAGKEGPALVKAVSSGISAVQDFIKSRA